MKPDFNSHKKAQKAWRGGAASKGLRNTINPAHPEVCQDRLVREMSVRRMANISLTLIPMSPGFAARLENLRGTRRSWELALQKKKTIHDPAAFVFHALSERFHHQIEVVRLEIFALLSVRILVRCEDFSGARTALSACYISQVFSRGQSCPRSFGCGCAALRLLCLFAAMT